MAHEGGISRDTVGGALPARINLRGSLVHGGLGGLGGGPSCEHYLLGGLAIRFVWGLGGTVLRVLRPPNFMR
jgi:hypothetical protein